MRVLSNKVKYSEVVLDNLSTLNHKGDHESMDAECVDLCDTLNSMKGITTNESCCGHNYQPYRIWFNADSLEPLTFIQSCIDRNYWEYGDQWFIELCISDTKPFLNFALTSKSTDLKTIMVQVESMINVFNHYLNHENRFEYLGQKYENFIFTEVEKELTFKSE